MLKAMLTNIGDTVSHGYAFKHTFYEGVGTYTFNCRGDCQVGCFATRGADDEGGFLIGLGGGVEQAGVFNEGHHKSLGRTLAQTVGQKGQRLILEIPTEGGQQLAVFGIGADGGGKKVHSALPF